MKAHGALLLLVSFTTGCSNLSKQAPPRSQSPAPTAVKAKTSFHLLPDTASPTGKYALGWGVRGNNNVDWKRLENGDDKYLDSLLGDTGANVEDYLVNKNSRTVIGTLQGVRYWQIANRSENHGAMQVAWRADEHLLLVVHQGKWTFQSFDAMQVDQNAITHKNDIGKAMIAAVRTWCDQHHPAEYQPVKDQLVISLAGPVINSNQLTYVVNIDAEVPKAVSGFALTGKGTFRIQDRARGAVNVTLVSLVEM
jgi:hypothetical protein